MVGGCLDIVGPTAAEARSKCGTTARQYVLTVPGGEGYDSPLCLGNPRTRSTYFARCRATMLPSRPCACGPSIRTQHAGVAALVVERTECSRSERACSLRLECAVCMFWAAAIARRVLAGGPEHIRGASCILCGGSVVKCTSYVWGVLVCYGLRLTVPVTLRPCRTGWRR